ncbi:hypothetical protein AAC387_Pa07g2584 [Persea americana]
MDVPSTSRVRPTTSNRRWRPRLVTDDLSESDEEVIAKEVVEDHPQAQEQLEEVHGQAEVHQRTSIADSSRTGEIPGGSMSLLPSFWTHIAFSIW